jgi:hypothetical protein
MILKPPYCTENGVHIFPEDLALAASERDDHEAIWRRRNGFPHRCMDWGWTSTPPDSILLRDWLAGGTFVGIGREYRTSPEAVSKRIARIRQRAERRAGEGARPIFDALIRSQRKSVRISQ